MLRLSTYAELYDRPVLIYNGEDFLTRLVLEPRNVLFNASSAVVSRFALLVARPSRLASYYPSFARVVVVVVAASSCRCTSAGSCPRPS